MSPYIPTLSDLALVRYILLLVRESAEPEHCHRHNHAAWLYREWSLDAGPWLLREVLLVYHG